MSETDIISEPDIRVDPFIVLDSLYSNHGSLDPDMLLKLRNITGMDSYSFLATLCQYLNMTKCVAHRGDFDTIMSLRMEIEDLTRCVDEQRQDYNQLSHEKVKLANDNLTLRNELDVLKAQSKSLMDDNRRLRDICAVYRLNIDGAAHSR